MKNNFLACKNIITFLVGFLIINIGGLFLHKLRVALNTRDFQSYNMYSSIMPLLFILFGIIIELQRIEKFNFSKKPIRPFMFTLAILSCFYAILPHDSMLNFFGLGSPNSFRGIIALAAESTYTRTALSVLGGILLVRSFTGTARKAPDFSLEDKKAI